MNENKRGGSEERKTRRKFLPSAVTVRGQLTSVFGSVGLNIIGCLAFLFLSPTVLCSLYSVLLVALSLTSFFLILPHDLSHVH